MTDETDDTVLARRLAQRLMPFLLGGLRAPLPQFDDVQRIKKEPLPKTARDTREKTPDQDPRP